MKNKGVTIIIENSKQERLFQLRDDKQIIQYPNCWTLPGGKMEAGETPKEAVEREMKEEMDVVVEGQKIQYFRVDDVIKFDLAFHDNEIFKDFLKINKSVT